MSNEIQLVSDADGLTLIGNPTDIEHFIFDHGLDRAPLQELDLRRIGPLLSAGGAAARVGSVVVESSGRWVKLTAESARVVKRFGLMPTKIPGVSHAMVGRPGDIKQWIQIARAPGVLLPGPVALSMLSTVMQQQAMQRQMEEMVEYLQEINEKVDDILRAQKDGVLADMIGVDLVIEEALTVRNQVGRVSDITWSKVQATSMSIARTQAYALRQLEAIAEKLEPLTDPGEIAKATKLANPKVREWLAVMAHSFQLQDGLSVLELDRVIDASPEELDRHRVGLDTARQQRLELIARITVRLLTQMDETVRKANLKVLLNPFDSPTAVRACNLVTAEVLNFREHLGLDSSRDATSARRWGQAASEVRDRAVATTAEGVAAARRFGSEALDLATEAVRAVGNDDDGTRHRLQASSALDASRSVIMAAVDAAGSIVVGASSAGSAVGGLAKDATLAVGSMLQEGPYATTSISDLGPEAIVESPQSP